MLLKHARNQRKPKNGKALLRIFIENAKVALQSILRATSEKEDSQPLPTNLSIIRHDITGRLVVDPMELIAQVQKLKT
jgi:hypothetical protein